MAAACPTNLRSSPRRQRGGGTSAQQPSHEVTLVSALTEPAQESGQRSINKSLGPVDGTDAHAEVDEVNLDFAPASERQERDLVLGAGDGPNGPAPDIIIDRIEQILKPRGPVDDVLPEHRQGPDRTPLDLDLAAGDPTRILLDQF